MKIAITTPSGHIGHALTEILLKKGADLVLLCRHPEKLKDFEQQGATIFKGSLSDENFIIEATKGVDALFWLTPPDFQSSDFRANQNKLGQNAARAIKKNKISHVIDLSSVGAQHGSGTGPVNGLHDVEEILAKAATNITHMRAAYFFENYMMQLQSLKTGQVYLPVSDQVKIPMISTADIAQVAADRIMDTSWSGRTVVEVEGPQPLTFQQAAEQISKGLGRDIKHVQVDDDQAKQSLQQMGLSDNVTDTMLELYHGIGTGRVNFEGQNTEHVNTKTTLEDFAKQVIKPALEKAA